MLTVCGWCILCFGRCVPLRCLNATSLKFCSYFSSASPMLEAKPASVNLHERTEEMASHPNRSSDSVADSAAADCYSTNPYQEKTPTMRGDPAQTLTVLHHDNPSGMHMRNNLTNIATGNMEVAPGQPPDRDARQQRRNSTQSAACQHCNAGGRTGCFDMAHRHLQPGRTHKQMRSQRMPQAKGAARVHHSLKLLAQ